MIPTTLHLLSTNIKRRSRFFISRPFINFYSTQKPSPSQRFRLRSLATPTFGVLLATGVTYSIMATEKHNALLEQKHILTGMNEDHVIVATEERDNLDIVREARANKDLTEIEAYNHLKGSALLTNFTASTLRAKGKIVVPPVVFYNKDRTEVTIVVHLGTDLCGHDGIVHGGMLATLLDEALALVAMPSLPNYVGFTANLNIDYRRPVKSDQWLVMRGRLDRAEGRKAFVEAWIENLQGDIKYVEAKSLYISPKSPLARLI